jgi:hypothetical protein
MERVSGFGNKWVGMTGVNGGDSSKGIDRICGSSGDKG